MKNENIKSEQEWLRKKLDGAGEIKLPASLSAEALFAGMDEQETVEADHSVKNNVIRPMWHRWGSIAAALVIVAGAAWVWQRTADLGAKAEAPQATESVKSSKVEDSNGGDAVNFFMATEQPSPDKAPAEDPQLPLLSAPRKGDTDVLANNMLPSQEAEFLLVPQVYGGGISAKASDPGNAETILMTLPEGISLKSGSCQSAANELQLLCEEEPFGRIILYYDTGTTYRELEQYNLDLDRSAQCIDVETGRAQSASCVLIENDEAKHTRFYQLQFDGYVMEVSLYPGTDLAGAETKCDALVQSLQIEKT